MKTYTRKRHKSGISDLFGRYSPVIIIGGVFVIALIVCIVIFATREAPPDTGDTSGSGTGITEPQPDQGTKPDPDPKPDVTPDPDPQPQPQPGVDPDPQPTGFVNPLTGLETQTDMSMIRPIAVVFDNTALAHPQSGISKADVIFEYPMEGGYTRVMALYQSLDGINEIGPVRSARPYNVDLVNAFDAVFVHAGGSDSAYTLMKSMDIDRVDGVNGDESAFYRDAQRRQNYGNEHSLMLAPTLLDTSLDKAGIVMEHDSEWTPGLTFVEEASLDDGGSASRIVAAFSSQKRTVFEYSAVEGKYMVEQFNTDYTDKLDGSRVGAENVVLLYAQVRAISGDSVGRLDITLTGSGSGYLAVGGKYVEICWSRESVDSQFVLTDTAGRSVPFRAGTSYCCIVPIGRNVDFT